MHFKENLTGVGGTSTEMTAESLPPTMRSVFNNPESLSKSNRASLVQHIYLGYRQKAS